MREQETICVFERAKRERGVESNGPEVLLKIIEAPLESHLPAVCIERRRESVCV
jgi:hypothetical protein